MVKTKTLIIFTIISTALLTGCSKKILPDRIELNDLMLIRAVGVDKGVKSPDNIGISIVSKKETGGQSSKDSGGSGGSSSKGVILNEEAGTFFEAERLLQTISDKKMFWGHVDYYMVGEEAAREGIVKYIDFLARDHETRNVAKLYIVEGTTARDFIQKTNAGDIFIPDRLKSIGKNSKLVTGPQEEKFQQFLENLNIKYSCTLAPVLRLEPENKEKEEGEKTKFGIDLDGYAIFKNLKLVGLIDKNMARAENFLLNKVESGVIEVKDSEGKMVGLEIIESNTKIEPKFEKDEIKQINIKVQLSSNIDEVHSTDMMFNKKNLEYLKGEQSKAIKKQIEYVISYAQKNNFDFIEIANTIEKKYPIKWKKYKDRWDEVFPNLPIKVEVVSKINRIYDFRDSIGVLEEEESK